VVYGMKGARRGLVFVYRDRSVNVLCCPITNN